MADLFSSLAAPVPPLRPADTVARTATFKRLGAGALAFVHPCGGCGNAVAPFGYGVKLRAAIDSQDATQAGRWLCTTCRDIMGDLQ